MAKDQGVKTPTVQKAKGSARTPATAVVSSSVAAPAASKRRTSPAQFVKEVRAEARKITWTSWKETWITSVMVLIMVVTASLFLFVVDLVLRFGIGAIIKLGS